MLNLARRTTSADYHAAEQNSERRHEFLDGVIVAMAGGSDEHNAIRVPLLRPVRDAHAERVPRLHLRSAILDRCDST
jgi:Uma2 family endonuclease